MCRERRFLNFYELFGRFNVFIRVLKFSYRQDCLNMKLFTVFRFRNRKANFVVLRVTNI
jgi:hypothetical protein